jgi:parallel beta-helix repeat protein
MCPEANLSHVDKVLKNPSILKNEGDGVWLLNANLTIADGANFSIDSNDARWVKINSTTSDRAYHLEVLGNLRIDSVKISSWNTTANNYTSTDGEIHRASIAILPEAKGKTDITNSEISYLGYHASLRQGLSYYGGDGSTIKNNTIHHLWYGFYSKGRNNITIENNLIYANVKYGLDPHTGTRNMLIQNNKVYGNDGIGVVCSFDCTNITMQGNEIYGNKLSGIMLSRNVKDSNVRNNTIYNEIRGIVVSESHQDHIYNNTIKDTDIGIETKFGSSKNIVRNNSIVNAGKYGIQVVKGSNDNIIMRNDVIKPVQYGICVHNNGTKNIVAENVVTQSEKHGICVYNNSTGNTIKSNFIDGALGYGLYITDNDATNNTFEFNDVDKAKVGIAVRNNTDSIFTQNAIGVVEGSEYLVTDNSTLKLDNTTFTSDTIKSSDGTNNKVAIFNSGMIEINGEASNKTELDTNQNPLNYVIPNDESINVRTVK